MDFLKDHFGGFSGYIGYHARTLFDRRHRSVLLGICSGEGRATAVILRDGKVVEFADDFSAVLDPPMSAETIPVNQKSRIEAVPQDQRASRLDGFRRKFLEAGGAKSRVRTAFVLDRPRNTVVSDVTAGKRNEDTRLQPVSVYNQIERAPADKITNFQAGRSAPNEWRWHLLLPTLQAAEEDKSYDKFLAFGAAEADINEAEAWAEATGRVEIDRLLTGQYAALRFLAEGFFDERPAMIARFFAASGPVIDTTTQQLATPTYRAMLMVWDGSKVTSVSYNLEMATFAQRIAQFGVSLRKEAGEASRRAAAVSGGREEVAAPLGPIPCYVLAAPEVVLPNNGEHYEVIQVSKALLCDSNGAYRRKCADVARALESFDLPGSPELILAVWSALRLDGLAAAKGDDPTERLLGETYLANQIRRTDPIMRRAAGATIALALLAFLSVPFGLLAYMGSSKASAQQFAAQAAAKAKTTELGTYGETTIRLEDLSGWRGQAERWPLSAVVARFTAHLPAALGLRDVRVRALGTSLVNPTGYELTLSGAAISKDLTGTVPAMLGEVFPGASIREIPPNGVQAGALAADGVAAPLPDGVQTWRCVLSLDCTRLDPAQYGLTPAFPTSNPATP